MKDVSRLDCKNMANNVSKSIPESGERLRLPPWMKVKTGKGKLGRETHALVHAKGLHTVCESARCPNIGECYACKTATFMIMGGSCTRNCGFCAVDHGKPELLDADEPRRLAEAVAELGLKYVVVTSVTRDDLPDGGAEHFAATIRAIKAAVPEVEVEVLTPDFQGDLDALQIVLDAKPDVFNHNVETVQRLQKQVRPQASYETSLKVLRAATDRGAVTKSGLMVGLGETDEEIRQALRDMVQAGVRIATIGQYLAPSRNHLLVQRYPTPEEFDEFAKWGRQVGIRYVFAGPFVRSSYHAAEAAKRAEAAEM